MVRVCDLKVGDKVLVTDRVEQVTAIRPPQRSDLYPTTLWAVACANETGGGSISFMPAEHLVKRA